MAFTDFLLDAHHARDSAVKKRTTSLVAFLGLALNGTAPSLSGGQMVKTVELIIRRWITAMTKNNAVAQLPVYCVKID